MARFSVETTVVVDGTTGKEQLTCTIRVRSKKIRTLTVTSDSMGRYDDNTKEWLWRVMCDCLDTQGGVYFVDDVHPWQHELQMSHELLPSITCLLTDK